MNKNTHNSYYITIPFIIVFIISWIFTQNIIEFLIINFVFLILLLIILAINNKLEEERQRRNIEFENAMIQSKYKKQKHRIELLKNLQELIHFQQMNKLHEDALANEINKDSSSALTHIRRLKQETSWKVTEMPNNETRTFSGKKL